MARHSALQEPIDETPSGLISGNSKKSCGFKVVSGGKSVNKARFFVNSGSGFVQLAGLTDQFRLPVCGNNRVDYPECEDYKGTATISGSNSANKAFQGGETQFPGRGINIALVDASFTVVDTVRYDTHKPGRDQYLEAFVSVFTEKKYLAKYAGLTVLLACHGQCKEITTSTYNTLEKKLGSKLLLKKLGDGEAWALIAQA